MKKMPQSYERINKRVIAIFLFFTFMSCNANALDLSRVKEWSAQEILTASDLNAEFNNILNHEITNNDIGNSAGIVGSKLDLSSPGTIGNTTASTGDFTTLTASGDVDITGTLNVTSTSLLRDKLSFTQTDYNEYIDSLADGYLDAEATTGIRLRINTTEQVNLIDGVFQPTTDNDIDLGASGKEFKDLFVDGTANIDSLVADTADINGGTLDGVNVNGATATGMLFVNDASDDLSQLADQGTTGEVLTSAGAGANPVWDAIGSDVSAGDYVIDSLDTERTGTSLSYTISKSFYVDRPGEFRFTWEMKNSSGGNTTYGKIYRNGIAVGAEKTVTGTSYTEVSDDISGWVLGDIAQLYMLVNGSTGYVQNFRMKINELVDQNF